eukprot:12886947-Prorocentrum_lima.AAC.1
MDVCPAPAAGKEQQQQPKTQQGIVGTRQWNTRPAGARDARGQRGMGRRKRRRTRRNEALWRGVPPSAGGASNQGSTR